MILRLQNRPGRDVFQFSRWLSQFNDMSNILRHIVSSFREREKRAEKQVEKRKERKGGE